MRTQRKYKETTQSASHLVVFDQCEFPYLEKRLIVFLRLFPSYFLTIRNVNYLYCYRGVGRTGAYIAIDAMLESAEKIKTVFIQNYMQVMRRSRPHMVQKDVSNFNRFP